MIRHGPRLQWSARRVAAAAIAGVSAASILVAAVVSGLAASRPTATFADAVELRDHDLARSLAASAVDPDRPLVLGLTPLMRSALRDDAAMVHILVDAGASLEATDPAGVTALQMAAQVDAVSSLDALLEAGGDPHYRSRNGMAAFDHAATRGSVDALALLAPITDIDGQSAVVAQGHGPPRDVGATPLGLAVRAGKLAGVEALLDLGADVDAPSSSGHTPLLIAVFSNQPAAMVALLLDRGADAGVVATCNLGCAPFSGNAAEWARELHRPDDVLSLLDAASP